MIEHEFDQRLSLDTISDIVAEKAKGSGGADVSFALLQRMAQGSDLKDNLVELHLQGGKLYTEAMAALQKVVGNAGVERLHEQITQVAQTLDPERAKGDGGRRAAGGHRL
ncbi:MAG: hypothetical protein AUK47_09840 [Deltaproteobacteria bacterium CG2_30_63_29]|nr:MAG: hypothetical protein AUK47_09840 [Deltaproteobacteria bacterium CG2_30_63_29]PJB38229.1 MAG: hypothetical protein CO108_19440 [Deltaproteobacteria bacterium CG_4_9_14_3_um_filter_63_12]